MRQDPALRTSYLGHALQPATLHAGQAGQLRAPAHIFGTPAVPHCLDGVAAMQLAAPPPRMSGRWRTAATA